MALALAGNGGSVKFNSGSAEINFLNNWKISINGAELDTTKFGDTDKRRAVGLKSGSGSAGGTFISGDTTGQDALWTAYQARTAVTLDLYVDGTNKVSASVIFTKLNFADDVAGVATCTFDFEVDGKVTVSTF
jgi:hypothetical protein